MSGSTPEVAYRALAAELTEAGWRIAMQTILAAVDDAIAMGQTTIPLAQLRSDVAAQVDKVRQKWAAEGIEVPYH